MISEKHQLSVNLPIYLAKDPIFECEPYFMKAARIYRRWSK